MLEIHVITAFPNLFTGPLDESIVKRAINKKLVSVFLHDIRDYSTDKHHQIDDYPYGGGAGMVFKPEPLFCCLEDIIAKYHLEGCPVTLMSAMGELYSQKKAVELSLRDKLILLCGHYKGIDERVLETWVNEEISIGDFILTGGELPAMVIIDTLVRLLPGAIGDIDSAETDSFQCGLLDHPHYTRPEVYHDMAVPKVLLSGNHAEIQKWRHTWQLNRTRERRLDLYNKYVESEK
jgi:tRNA (guanine37-N1)-methyltransferase